MFFDRDNKTKLVPASFSYFLDLFEKKNDFQLKSVLIITVIIFLYYKETKFFYLCCSPKKVIKKSNQENIKVI